MTRSMTGFGTVTIEDGGWRIEVTIRTLNHRFLSVRIRSLNDHPSLLPRIEERVKAVFARGEVGVWVTVDRSTADGPECRFDRRLAQNVLDELTSLSDELGFEARPTLEDVSRAGGLQPIQIEDEQLWPVLERALDAAMENANASRDVEGQRLGEALGMHLDQLSASLAEIRGRAPEILAAHRANLSERARQLELKVDPARFEVEVALLAERLDVQEEIVRLEAHLARAREALRGADPIGKELDFLSQEMLREVNTLGAKARDVEAGTHVVDMKLAVERFREQVQNVE
jgi:uncharacterized protein (TIGR00255 family)